MSRGFKGTNVSEIAHEAGIAVGSFYKFFTAKRRAGRSVEPEMIVAMFKSVAYIDLVSSEELDVDDPPAEPAAKPAAKR